VNRTIKRDVGISDPSSEAKEPLLSPPRILLLYTEEVSLYNISTDEILNYK
jgi:hypothetical protein